MRAGRAIGGARAWSGIGLALLLLSIALLFTASRGDAADDGEWVVVPPQSLEIPAGSPLDFSAMVPTAPAGSRGRVTIRDGRLVFDGDGSAAKFNCAMVNAVRQRSTFPTHAEADALALQLRRHGYTLVRQQFVDQRLTRHARSDVDIDPEQLDRFFYFQGALKRAGIAWMLDIVSGPGTGVRGQAWEPSTPDDLRVRMHFDPAARALWLRLVDAVFARTNPYTGMSTLADPALAMVSGANENSIAFGRSAARPFPTGFGVAFDRWVRARFPTPAALAQAVPDLSVAERAGTAPVALPAGWTGSGPRTALLLRFVAAREIDTNRWMRARLAERGFRGPNLGHNDWYPALTGETRAALPMVDVHAYGGEVASFAPGTRFRVTQATTPDGVGLWTLNAAQRWYGRPMMVSEYDSPFPNRYRYESGLLLPAIAGFQQFGPLCRMAFSPVEPAVPAPGGDALPLRAYAIGLDPAERAAETLAAMLYFRGDVAPARRIVAATLGGAAFDAPGAAVLPAGISRATLLARFGLIAPGAAASLPRDALLLRVGEGAGDDTVVARLWRVATGSREAQVAGLVAALRANGTLGKDNRTDAAKGVFQSETGELVVDGQRGRIEVVTPRTEAVSTTGPDAAIALGRLTIGRVDAGTLVAVTALDGQPVARSRRMLVVLSGDVRNQGMRFERSGDDWTFRDWGRLPMEMRRVQADATLRSDVGGGGYLTALSLRGTPLLRRAVARGADGALRVSLDTAGVPGNPTTFFLLELP